MVNLHGNLMKVLVKSVMSLNFRNHLDYLDLHTVKPLITNTLTEFIKCRILYFLIMECCRYLVF